jgi:integrase
MAGKLSARKVETAKPGKYADGGGLYLAVAPSGAKKWTFRFLWNGRAREAGLGSVNSVGLADARDKAHGYRTMVAKGIDPILAAQTERQIPNFGECADAFIAAKEPEWRNGRNQKQWKASLTEQAAKLRTVRVDKVDTAAVLDVLKPIWVTTPESAARLRGRIELVLDAARANNHRSGENPARWRGHLDKLLPKRGKHTFGHYAAMPYEGVAGVIAKVRAEQAKSLPAFALEFAILTVARSGEVRNARWPEMDIASKVWTVPAEQMKAGREHRVPLCPRALAILESVSKFRVSEFVFPGERTRKPLGHSALYAVLRRVEAEASVHGFRSSFRDWAGNETNFPREVAEAALAHAVGDKSEQAYRRSDALEKRRKLMIAWANYCDPEKTSRSFR